MFGLRECIQGALDLLAGKAVEVADRRADSSSHSAGTDRLQDADEFVLDRAAIQRLENLAGGDPAIMAEFIDASLQNAPTMVGEIEQGVDRADATTLRRIAHNLKSNSAALGASRLSGLCKELEEMGRNETLGGASEKLHLVALELQPVQSALESVREGYCG